MTTMTTAGLPSTVTTALDMTAGHIETHGLACAEWSLKRINRPKVGCAIGTLRIVCGLPAEWDGFDSEEEQAKERATYPKRHKLFMAALDTLIAYLGFEYHASDGKTYDGTPAVISWSDSHANGDNGIEPTPEAVAKGFREAARLARVDPKRGFHAYETIGETRTCRIYQCTRPECGRTLTRNKKTGKVRARRKPPA